MHKYLNFAKNYRAQNHGSALISALFIVSLVAIAATAMSMRLQVDLARTKLIISNNEHYLASQAVTFWAIGELSNANENFTKANEQGKVLDFPKELKNLYPGVILEGSLYDLQARFNINNLLDPTNQILFFKLLTNLTNNVEKSKEIMMATFNWLTPYKPGRGHDPLINYYLKQKPPYLPSHLPLRSTSEFRLIKGVEAKIYQALKPYICALPKVVPININTSSIEVLASLTKNPNKIIEARGKSGIKDLNKLEELIRNLHLSKRQVTIESQYFLAIANTNAADFSATHYAILQKTKDNNDKISVNLIGAND